MALLPSFLRTAGGALTQAGPSVRVTSPDMGADTAVNTIGADGGRCPSSGAAFHSGNGPDTSSAAKAGSDLTHFALESRLHRWWVGVQPQADSTQQPTGQNRCGQVVNG